VNGPDHYREAENHLTIAAGIETDGDQDSMSAWHQRQAQVHATLALAAATAVNDFQGWCAVAIEPERRDEVAR
jgi:glucokinase